MHDGQHRPSGQEVDTGAPELASAGAGKDEDQALVELDELMDHRQQLGHPLHLSITIGRLDGFAVIDARSRSGAAP